MLCIAAMQGPRMEVSPCNTANGNGAARYTTTGRRFSRKANGNERR